MIASRRAWHYRMWLVLVPAMIALLAAALAVREARPVQAPIDAQAEERRP